METDIQNTHLVDRLPRKTAPVPVVRQSVKDPRPFHKERPTKLLVLIGCVFIIILLISLNSGWTLYQQDPLTKPVAISPTSSAPRPTAPAEIVSPVSALSMPDLTTLVKVLNSRDPATRKLGLAPMVRDEPSKPPDLLPAGSTVELKPETWTVLNVDEKNEPYVAWIQALVTVPGEEEPQSYDLHLIHADDRWLLYNTSKR